MVNRLWQATGFCPPFAFLPDGSGLVIPPSKRRIAKTCKFLPKNTLFRSPATVHFDPQKGPKRPPPPPPLPTRFETGGLVTFTKPPNPRPPRLVPPAEHNF